MSTELLSNGKLYYLVKGIPKEQNFPFPEGGGGCGKTFKVYPRKTLSPCRKVIPASLPDFWDMLRALQKKKESLRKSAFLKAIPF